MVLNCRSLPPFCASVESNIRGSAKICRPPMVEVMTTKITVGRMLGTVTDGELPEAARPVDRGGVVQVARHGLHGGQQDQRVVARSSAS